MTTTSRGFTATLPLALAVTLLAPLALAPIGVLPARAAEITPDTGQVHAAAYVGSATSTLPETITVDGVALPVAWDAVDTTTAYATTEVGGTVEGGDTVRAQVEVVPADVVYFIDSGGIADTPAYEAVRALAGTGEDATMVNAVADQEYTGDATWGYDLDGTPGNKPDWTPKTNAGPTKDATGHYAEDNPASYVLDLEPGKYSVTVGAYEWWNSPGRRQDVTLIAPDGTATPIASDVQLDKGRVVVSSAALAVDQEGSYRLSFSQVSGGYPVVSWIGVAKVASTTAAPVIDPGSGTFSGAKSVSISSSTPGAAIHYTLDGTDPTTASPLYEGPFRVTASTTVKAIAAVGDDVSPVSTAELTISVWAATAVEFKLRGGQAADNVKVTWDTVPDADRYEVYRGPERIAQSSGDTVDDYGLEVGHSYDYTVKAFHGDSLLATSAVATAEPFIPSGDPVGWDNTTGGNDLGLPTGVEVDGTYYRYSVHAEGGSSTIREATSADGRTFGSERDLVTLPDTKLEGFAAHLHPTTGRIILAAHRENAADYTEAELFLAEVAPGGELTVTYTDRPLGRDSRDMSLFVDTDGSAYVVSATNTNADTAIYRLNETWTAPESLVTVAFTGQHRETPAIVRVDGVYYFFGSRASGWLPSQAMYASAGSLAGPWSELRQIGNAATYGTQSNTVKPFGDGWAMYGYRWGANWNPPEPTGNYPRLLPVTFNAGFASMEYYSAVEYYPGTGLVPVQAGRLASLGKPVSVTVDEATAHHDEQVVTDGADLASSAVFRSGDEGTADAYPYDLVIDLQTAHRLTEIDTTTFLFNGSEAAYQYTIEGSLDGSTWTELVDGSANKRPGYLIDEITDQGAYRYVKLAIASATKVKDGGGVTGWGDGIHEVAVFGEPVATPVADPPGGTYFGAQRVALTSGDPDAVIHYTLDGSEPSADSPVYGDPIEISEFGEHTLRAVAISDGQVSDVLTVTYVLRSGDTPVGLAETPAYAVVAGQDSDLPTTVRVTTADGNTVDAPVSWDLTGMTFTKPYRTYPVYGTVAGLDEPVAGTIETLAPDTIVYIDSAATSEASTAYRGAARLLGDALLNDAADQAKTASTTWGHSGVDGSQTQAGPKEVNGHYGKNGDGNVLDYTLHLPEPGTYTLALGLHEWWSAADRAQSVTVIDAAGTSHDVARSEPGAITPEHRDTAVAGTFTLSEAGAGTVTVRMTNAGWQGAVVTWLAVAEGDQDLDLSPEVVAAPTIEPSAGRFYNRPQQVTITAAPEAVVYYTTDGSTPSRLHGTRYAEPFTVSETTTVNAVAVVNGVASPVTTAAYTIVVQEGPYTSVPVGQPWFDTSGNPIQAHGAGFLEHDDWYYWVGEDKAHNSASFNGVNLYRSRDLLNWDFVATILAPEAAGLDCGTTGQATCKVERPKLVYNEQTRSFVLWGHWETAADYTSSQVVVATSPTIDGPYAVQYHGRPGVGEVWDLEQTAAIQASVDDGSHPDFAAAEAAYRAAGHTPAGHQSRDFTVYVDADGRGWLISAEAHVQLRIYPLSDDFVHADPERSYPVFTGESREAAAITEVDGEYYLFTSGQSGWYPNQLKYAHTADLSDPEGWSANTNVGNNTTFKSQPTSILQLQRSDGGSSLVYMGDRWVPSALGTSTYVWLPLQIDADRHTATLNFTDSWRLDAASGEIVDQGNTLLSRGKPASASPSGSLSAGYSDDVADPGEDPEVAPAAAANDGVLYTTNRYDNSHYYFPGDTSTFSWQVDLGAAYDLSRVDISWRSYNGSETYSQYVLAGSNDGRTWTTVADRSHNRVVGFTSDRVAGRYRYVRVAVDGVVNDHNGNGAGWASGLVEVEVYGSEPPESVAIGGGDRVKAGDTLALTATVSPEGADQRVVWSSADPAVATVDPDGTVRGVAPGSTTVTATSAADDTISASVTVEVLPRVPVDNATRAPAVGRLSSDEGWDTGLSDGTFRVTMNMWWGENGSLFTLYRDGAKVADVPLEMASPRAQQAVVDVAGLPNGTYRFTGELTNSRGTTPTEPLVVEVRHAAPGKPALSHDNWDGDGSYTLTANLWWGTNATGYRFLEDGVEIGRGVLEARSPQAQRATVQVSGRNSGVHTYTVEFTNAAGTTTSDPVPVVVRR